MGATADHPRRLPSVSHPSARIGRAVSPTEPPDEDSITLLRELLEALIIDRYIREGEGNLIADSGEQSAREQEVLFYQEAIEQAEKAITRNERLEPLRFADPLVAEATRCFLYQFHRATVLLCATALETRLKSFFPGRNLCREAGDRNISYFEHLVAEAVGEHCLPEAYKVPADAVFEQRNRVAHRGTDPEWGVVQQVLDATRMILEAITPPSP